MTAKISKIVIAYLDPGGDFAEICDNVKAFASLFFNHRSKLRVLRQCRTQVFAHLHSLSSNLLNYIIFNDRSRFGKWRQHICER
jgi:hypothetical protein